jgi:large-conductance mechanosensitive channel
VTGGQWVEALVGFLIPTAAVGWGLWMVWRWVRPDFKHSTRIVPGVVEFVLVCVLVILIVLAWEMFKTWRRPQNPAQPRSSANELLLKNQ